MKTVATTPLIGLLVGALAFILVFPVHAAAQVCVQPPSGIVSWWNGNSVSGTTATDIVDGNPGAMSGGVSLVSTMFGNSFQFDGVSGQIGMGNPSNLNFGTGGTFSLEAWFQLSGNQTGINNIIRKSTYIPSGGTGYWIRAGGGASWVVQFFAGNTSGNPPNGNIVIPVTPGAWHHVVGTRDATGTMTLYLDGASGGSVSGLNADTTSSDSFVVGAWDQGNEFFGGLIDQISVYNRALTAQEVLNIFNAGSAGKCSGPPPIAKVGPDQTVNEGTLVTLDGSGSSDSNNKPLTYTWTQVAGPTVVLNLADPVHPTFTAPAAPIGGITLTFQLAVNNGSQTSFPVTANVTVKHVNHPPVANAGPNQTVGEGALVTLDGSASYDPDGDPITFQWTQTGGPTVSLSSATAIKPIFTAPPVPSGSVTLTFKLTVNDGSLSSTALVSITAEHVNHPPIANAGPNQTVNDTKIVTLDGSASSDPDSDPLTYAWVQVSGTPVTLSSPTAVKPTFTAPIVSASGDTLVFQLTVTDPGLLSSSATTNVTVVHQKPVCSAAQPSQAVLWPPNHKLILVNVLGVTDPDNLSTTIAVTAVTQDEPVNGLGDGDTSPDAVIQGQGVLLRAERAGTGNGRVYHVSFTATDSQGGSCTGSVNVSVPHDKQSTAIDDGQLYNSLQP